MSQHALIIDDNAGNVKVLGGLLSLEGISYTQVRESRLLPEVLQELTGVDVVFLDLEMPDLNGYEVLKLIQAQPAFQNVPVVAHTVHINEIAVARDLGFHSFISKPVKAERFPDQLARILRGEHVWERS
ncbi:MAG: response regulator [Anaerolineae bacterium]|nr:response regulator [Anaerolineae bacterium]